MYESQDWEGLTVCAKCMSAVTQWLIKNQLIEDNPFAEALLDTGDSTERDGEYRVWYQREDAPANAFSDLYLTRVIDDGEK